MSIPHMPDGPRPSLLRTTIGDFPLEEYRLRVAGREWAVLHTGALISRRDESSYLGASERLPYGVVLWPAAIALAHDVAARAQAFAGARVLELGAGTGLPGIVAASLGARVVQTERQPLAMSVCERNAARNGVTTIQHRVADWSRWADDARYDWIIGSDILYARTMHPHLRAILERNLAPGGRALLADPFREASVRMLEGMEREGWRISMSRWSVGEDESARPIGVFELAAP